ncbi:MAG: glutamate--cysteine ligase [Actinomycetota bacterium]
MERRFGESRAFTVGVEEEFQLTDPSSCGLIPAIDAVLAARDAAGLGQTIDSELSASCLESRSPVYESVAELAEKLPALRRRVREVVEGCGARLVSAGSHPFSKATKQKITARERYHKVEEEMGWTARMQAIYGLHVHVAVPDEEYAIRAVNALSRHVPLFLALSANSPFWEGRDTRLASVRVKVFDLVPRSGLPPHFATWESFERYVETLVSSGSIPDYSWCWWYVRPHPKFGTVELRAPDAQTEPERVVSLAALAQCIVAAADGFPPEDPLLTAENKWRATRHGIDARLHDFGTGESTTVRETATRLVNELLPVSRDLGCEAELEGVLDILSMGTGAERQRAVFAKHGSLEAVVGDLAARTA